MTRPTRLYIATVVLAAVGLTVAMQAHVSAPSLQDVLLGLIFSGLMVLAVRYPLDFGPQMKVHLDPSVTIACILLFPPGYAMLIVGVGVFVAELLRRTPLSQRLFNTAQIMLQAGVGGLILQATGWNHSLTPFTRPVSFAGFLVAILVMNLLMIGLVATVAWLYSGRRPPQLSPRAIWDTVIVDMPAQVSLGVLAVAVARTHTWALPLLVPLGIALHRARERHLELKKKSETLAHQATHDSLTRLPNRTRFLECLEALLSQAEEANLSVAVLFLDLDNFKLVNDSLGHEAGDELLVMVANRLQMLLRQSDTVARLGGDEFTILLPEVGNWRAAMDVVDRLATGLQVPFALEGHDFVITASIGIAISTPDAATPEDFLRHADMAMYEAKRRGKAQAVLFEPAMADARRLRLELETDLRRALRDEEFQLEYQPVVDLTSGRLEQVEALVRWEHPERGLLPPSEFIWLAEETGLIVPLGKWILTEAAREVHAWQEERLGTGPIKLSVNLSARQFQDPRLVTDITETLRETGLDPRQLVLELTESVMLEAADTTMAQLRALRQLGCGIAIDDFGTGYSSLGYLARFPIDSLKIDRSFISGLGHTPVQTAIVRAILAFADTLHLTTTAEGIETVEQMNELKALGCVQGQGYYISRPLSRTGIDSLLSATELRQGAVLGRDLVDITRLAVEARGEPQRHTAAN